MNRNALLRIVNPVLGFLAISQITTGLLGDVLSHDAFEVLHEGGGITLAVVAVLHVVLNWNWVKVNMLRMAPAEKP